MATRKVVYNGNEAVDIVNRWLQADADNSESEPESSSDGSTDEEVILSDNESPDIDFKPDTGIAVIQNIVT